MKDDSIGRTGKHSEFCEGHVSCPTTNKEECGKGLNYLLGPRGGKGQCVTVMCFGCDKPHGVREE